jgi:predicted type IV restriction endonuclease
MDLVDRLKALSSRIPSMLDSIQTEEATKNALVMPFISALGYDVFDPTEVTPELVADVGIKKGEKVDYAILKEGKPILLFECKAKSAKLDTEHASQLHRYFHVTSARFGVLTNGVIYRFYTDLEQPNKMDTVPFLELDMLNLKEHDVDEVRKFAKSYFSEGDIVTSASNLKYTREIKKLLVEEFRAPTADFVRFFASKVYQGRITQPVVDSFSEYVKMAHRQLMTDHINDRLQTALTVETNAAAVTNAQQPNEPTPAERGAIVETTDEELEAFYIVKSILRETVTPSRVALRDVQSYCGILLDDNNRKPIVRLYLDRLEMQIGIFDNPDRSESKVKIEEIDDIYKFASRIVSAVGLYESKPQPTLETA